MLPFENLSPQRDQDYFCDGVTEELINGLTQLEGLRVVARTSVFAFKGKHQDIRKVGQALNVSTVLEGSVRKSGNQLRITTQLISVADGYHLWSESYDREMEDVFAIQDEISWAIVKALRIKLAGDSEDRPLGKTYTDNLEAYNLYLKGRYCVHKWSPDGLEQGIRYFEQAIVAEPFYAPAHSGLADAYTMLGYWGFVPWKETILKARAAAIKALEIDETLAEARVSLGNVRAICHWDLSGAEREYRRALELNPDHAMAHYSLCHYTLAQSGPFDEALAEANRALELDPLSLLINTGLGWCFYSARRYDEAIEQCRKTLELDPTYLEAYWPLAMSYEQKSMFAEAIAVLQKARSLAKDVSFTTALLARNHFFSGNQSEAEKVLQELTGLAKRQYVAASHMALAYMAFGENDQAFDCLGRPTKTATSRFYASG